MHCTSRLQHTGIPDGRLQFIPPLNPENFVTKPAESTIISHYPLPVPALGFG